MTFSPLPGRWLPLALGGSGLLHPTRPWLVQRREPRTIERVDLDTGEATHLGECFGSNLRDLVWVGDLVAIVHRTPAPAKPGHPDPLALTVLDPYGNGTLADHPIPTSDWASIGVHNDRVDLWLRTDEQQWTGYALTARGDEIELQGPWEATSIVRPAHHPDRARIATLFFIKRGGRSRLDILHGHRWTSITLPNVKVNFTSRLVWIDSQRLLVFTRAQACGVVCVDLSGPRPTVVPLEGWGTLTIQRRMFNRDRTRMLIMRGDNSERRLLTAVDLTDATFEAMPLLSCVRFDGPSTVWLDDRHIAAKVSGRELRVIDTTTAEATAYALPAVGTDERLNLLGATGGRVALRRTGLDGGVFVSDRLVPEPLP